MKGILLLGVHGVGKTRTARLIIKKLEAQNKKIAIKNLDVYYTFHEMITKIIRKLLFSEDWPTYYGQNNFKAQLDNQKYRRLIEITKKLLLLRYLLLVLSIILSYIIQKILSMWYDVLVEHEGNILKSINTFYFVLYSCSIKRFNMNFILRVLPIMLKDWTILYFPVIDYKILKNRYERRGSAIEPYDYLHVTDIFYKKMIKYLHINPVQLSKLQTLLSIVDDEYK